MYEAQSEYENLSVQYIKVELMIIHYRLSRLMLIAF